jgi:hypothetical protein
MTVCFAPIQPEAEEREPPEWIKKLCYEKGSRPPADPD